MQFKLDRGAFLPGRLLVKLREQVRWGMLLLVLLGGPALPAADFEFVVIGDTRPPFESENFQAFNALIPLINAAKPALVVNLGDLIYGYGLRRKEKQWDKYEEVIKSIQAPYYQLPGNHDTFSKAARKIYGRRFGKFYDSFDHEGWHFVLLDNTEAERWGFMGAQQLEWLKNDLRAAQGRPTLVFLHFPVWEPERVAAKYYEAWRQSLHPLFKRSNVRGVFAGHYHTYGPTREFDGIRYYITGGGGAELRPDYKKSGGEHHFLKVRTSGNAFDLRVVTAHGEWTDAEADIVGGLWFADKHSSRIGIQPGRQNLLDGVEFSVTVKNPYREVLEGRAAWALDASAYVLTPPSIAVSIPPEEAGQFAFTMKALRDTVGIQSLPRLEFVVAAGASHHRFHRDIVVLEEVKTPFRPTAPLLDGRLDDWGEAKALSLAGRAKPVAELRSSHNEKALFLAITLPDVKTEEAEESAFPDDLQIGFAEAGERNAIGSVLLRLGFSRSGRSVVVKERLVGNQKAVAVLGVKAVCQRRGGQLTFELAMPFAALKPLKIGGGKRVVADFAFRLPDEEPQSPGGVEPWINSQSYLVRYGGDALIPVHYVELDLEKSRAARPASE